MSLCKTAKFRNVGPERPDRSVESYNSPAERAGTSKATNRKSASTNGASSYCGPPESIHDCGHNEAYAIVPATTVALSPEIAPGQRRYSSLAPPQHQEDLFATANLILRPALIGPNGRAPFFVIGCSREKRPDRAPAAELYISKRFRSTVNLVQKFNAPYAILSAKHGIVPPTTLLDPYDVSLDGMSTIKTSRWAAEALKRLSELASGRRITLLTSPTYSSPLIELNQRALTHLDFIAPWMNLDRSDPSVWLAEASRMATRIQDLALLYDWIEEQRQTDRVFSFGSLAAQSVPKRGVYVFCDPNEPNFIGTQPRIVRIGTHAVSRGSKATLRGRLRNHLGPVNEVGNHRGSIFRLHVGRAMLEAGPGHEKMPSWGVVPDPDPKTREAELQHELAVSRYLQNLEVALIAIDDEPTKDSLRASVEAQLIALCSEAMRPIDCATQEWLGRKSPVEQIRKSGLWNIRGVGEKYDPIRPGSVTSIVHV